MALRILSVPFRNTEMQLEMRRRRVIFVLQTGKLTENNDSASGLLERLSVVVLGYNFFQQR